jgi:hypothetical protein
LYEVSNAIRARRTAEGSSAEAQSVARGIPGFCIVLGGSCSAHLEILGLKMVVSGQYASVKPTRQLNDKPSTREKGLVTVPAAWKLTTQQLSFIESFAVDDEKKANLSN